MSNRGELQNTEKISIYLLLRHLDLSVACTCLEQISETQRGMIFWERNQKKKEELCSSAIL